MYTHTRTHTRGGGIRGKWETERQGDILTDTHIHMCAHTHMEGGGRRGKWETERQGDRQTGTYIHFHRTIVVNF